MLKGFKEFLMKGNVVDLAVAVVIGAAFTAIVKAFTDGIVNPLIARIGGKGELGLGFQIGDSGNAETFVNIGTVVTAAINFVIIAAVVYFIIVMPYEKLKSLRAAEGEETQTEQELLAEIRDLLSGKDPSAAKALDQAKAAGVLSDTDGNLNQPTGSDDPLAAPPVTQHFSAPGGFNTPEPFGTSETYGGAPTATAEPPRASAEPFGSPSEPLTGTGPQPFGGRGSDSLTGTGPQPFGGPSEPLTGTGPQPFGGSPDRFGPPPERFDAPRPSGPPSGSFPAQPPSSQPPSGPPSGSFQAQPPSGSFPAQPSSGPTIVPPPGPGGPGGPGTPPPPPRPSEWNPQQPPQPPQGPPPGPGNADPFGTTRMGNIDPAAGGPRPDPRGPARDQYGRETAEGFGPEGPQGPPQGQQGPPQGPPPGGQHGRHQQ
ncbi:large-conductance mechanosensitive channel protein MscL [Jongsikchunia kroppenstedtii]|uniref:large-conductance mechanosensitive channel protein MscL n=1 Tax=Jongsikchunia kroppenstedtii TaxID=1121721 RepID=UPI00036A9345|nr:large-conductance mechanosensitive channel protein MscL [Jongsikchunia kroppenstedtii]